MAGISEGEVARGREVPIMWNGAALRAWVPAPLAGQPFELGSRAARLSERAVAAVVAAGNRPARFEPVAMLLLRSEGVASSFIEGIRSPLVDVAAAEVGRDSGPVAAYVADNLGAVVDALRGSERPLRLDDLLRWHRRLMGAAGGLPQRMVGAWRTEQSWVGGTSPRDAALVPPPAELVGGLMEDVVAFANSDALDPVTQAAVLHAQFETIHPFGDGNGRVGRILIGWVLAHRLGVALPPPVSVLIARDPGGYLAGLTLFRLGQLEPWVEWMASALQRSSEAAADLVARSEALVAEWRARLAGVREDAAARRVLELLPEHPIVSSAVVARRLGVSVRAGQAALVVLAGHGIVQRYRPEADGGSVPGRPAQYWVAGELVGLVTGWSTQ
jgi:Fic family protein